MVAPIKYIDKEVTTVTSMLDEAEMKTEERHGGVALYLIKPTKMQQMKSTAG